VKHKLPPIGFRYKIVNCKNLIGEVIAAGNQHVRSRVVNPGGWNALPGSTWACPTDLFNINLAFGHYVPVSYTGLICFKRKNSEYDANCKPS